MRYKPPKSLGGYNGGYGGMGSKPAPEAWGPGTGKTSKGTASRVKRLIPKRLRGLRLRSRSKRRRGEGTTLKRPNVYIGVGSLLSLGSLYALVMRVGDSGPGAFGGLLFFASFGVGGGLLCQGLSALVQEKRASRARRRQSQREE